MNDANTRLYLSRLFLDLRSRQVRSELAHPYEMHRTLMRAFPMVPPGEEKVKARQKFGVLFRAEVEEPRQRVLVYLQSNVKPDWSFLDSQAGYLCSDADPPNPAPPKDLTDIYRRLDVGQAFRFRLRANPTKRVWNVKAESKVSRGQRVALCTEKEQIEWLVRKGKGRLSHDGKRKESAGFDLITMQLENDAGQLQRVPRVSVRVEGMQRGHKKEQDRSREMTHLAVCFDGLMRVTDPSAFVSALTNGIGPAKSFGFGLLSIARR